MAFIELDDIHKTYRLGSVDVTVLRGITTGFLAGEFVALMGASGSGKTTLMNIIGCLDQPTGGRYWLEGQEISALSSDERAYLRSRRIGFVFQSFNLLRRTSALENVLMPLHYGGESLGNGAAQARARELLTKVGLEDRAGHEPSQLSGGQQQRVAIARALINKPSILLADEPTGNLDSRASEEVLEMFRRINEEERITIIMVTHDEHVASHASRIVWIHDGKIREDGRRRGEPLPAGSA